AERGESYAGKLGMKDPLASPLYADYTKGFPPTLIQTGTRDLFLSICARLHRKMQQAGVEVKISVAEGMWHVFQTIPQPAVPEAKEAFLELARFLCERVGK